MVGAAHAQTAVRAVLGATSAAALLAFVTALRRAAGPGPARWWLALVAGQFHLFFYASRPLGNVFAFVLSTSAFALLLRARVATSSAGAAVGQRQLALALFSLTAVVFRAEVALLLAAVGAYLLATGQVQRPLRQLAVPVVIAMALALAVSVPLDSWLWQRPLWPELWAFHYNAVLGRSADWGRQPWHYYLTSALPRLLLNPLALLVLLPAALVLPATAPLARDLAVPSLLFVTAYSILPHKETRFVLYVVPPLTAAAALAANYLFTRRAKSPARKAAAAFLVLSTIASAVAGIAMLLLSSLNYPGGDAIEQLMGSVLPARNHHYSIHNQSTAGTVAVHADVLSCMTGVTLFTAAQYYPRLRLDRTEDPAALADPAFWARFDYLLLSELPPSLLPSADSDWELLATIQAFAGLQVLRPGQGLGGAGDDDDSNGYAPVLGKGALVLTLADRLRIYSLGWWLGPRMKTAIRIYGKSEQKGY